MHCSHGLLWLLHCSTWKHWNWVSEELQHSRCVLCKYIITLTHSQKISNQKHIACFAHILFFPFTLVGCSSAQAVHQAACALKAWFQMVQEAVSMRPAVHVCTMERSTLLDRHWLWTATHGLYSAWDTHNYSIHLKSTFLSQRSPYRIISESIFN